jgi:hypothetical protein
VLGGVALPPADDVDQLLADLAALGAAGQQVLGAVDFRRLRQAGRAAVADQQVDGLAEGGIGGDAGIAVRAAALEARQSSEAGSVSRFAWLTMGSISRMRAMPASMDFFVPPVSWMVMDWKRSPGSMP